MDELRKRAIEKMQSDMMFCFECDEFEKTQAYENLYALSENELIEYLEG